MLGVINSDHYKETSGICAIINDHISLAYRHYLDHGNLHVVINNQELSEIFDFNSYDRVENQYDILDRHKEFTNPFFSNAHTKPIVEELKIKKSIFDQIFKIKSHILENFQKLNFNSTIAVHYRGTDKKYEVKPFPLDLLFYSIDKKLMELEQNSFFLATDDSSVLKSFKNHFGKKVQYHTDNYYAKRKPLHFSKKRQASNVQVMYDILKLSQSKHFYYSFSNVSHLALILGVNQEQFIYHPEI